MNTQQTRKELIFKMEKLLDLEIDTENEKMSQTKRLSLKRIS